MPCWRSDSRPRSTIASCGRDWHGSGSDFILYAVFNFTSSTAFPGINALLPVVGVGLLIQYGGDTSVGWLLSRKPLVFIGLISYSLYLWHWPIIIFSEYYLIHKLTGWGTIAAVAASLIVAALSWRYIERPFRGKGKIPRRMIFQGAAAVMALTLTVSVAGLASDGWASRFPEEVMRLESYASTSNARRDRCHREEDRVIAFQDSCVHGAATAPTYAVWGDNHAVELVSALGEIAGRHGKSVMQLTYSFCPPALGVDIPIRPHCRDYNDKAARFLADDSGVTTVILVSRYESYRWQADTFSAGIRKSVAALLAAGKRVILVYPIPTAAASIPRTLARYAAFGADISSFTIDEPAFLRRNSYAFALLDSLTDAKVGRIFPHSKLCHEAACLVYANGAPLYYDRQHLTLDGARYLAPLFEDLF